MKHRIFAALFLLSPLIILTNFPYPYSLPRWIFLTILCFVWSIALLIDSARKKINLQLSRLDLLFVFFVLTLGITTATSVDIAHSLWGSLERSFAFTLWPPLLVAFFGLKVSLQKLEDKTFLFRFFSIIVLITSLWGVLQKYIPGFSETFSGNRIGGTLGNAIFFGSYITLSIGILAFKLFEERKYSAWWFFTVITTIIAAITLLLTQTRGPLLGLCAGTIVALSTYLYKTVTNKRTKAFGLAGIIFVVALAGLLAYNKQITSQTTVTTRVLNWKMAWSGFKNKPVFGWGPENYNLAADNNFLPALSNYSIAETHADKPHNYFLEILVTSGIVGLVAYLILLAYATHSIFQAKIPPTQTAILCGLIAAGITQNLSSFETHSTATLFIVIIALISTTQKTVAAKKIETIILATLAVSMAVIILSGTVPIIKDSSAYFSAIKLTDTYKAHHDSIKKLQQHFNSTPFARDYFTTISFAIVGQYWQNPTGYSKLSPAEQTLHLDDIQWLRNAITEIDAKHSTNGAWKLQLANSSYQIFSLTRTEADGAQTEKLYSDYTRIAPKRQEPLMQLGQIELLRSNPEKSLQYFDSAITLDPNYTTPHWQRCLSLFALKKHSLAWSEIEFLMSKQYEFRPPQIANYIYNQLLGNGMQSEAEKFRIYFESSNF